MSYAFVLSEDYDLIRSRHSGRWVIRKRNTHYGYFATIHIFDGPLTITSLSQASRFTGIPFNQIVDTVEDVIRTGTTGIRPRPGFKFDHNESLPG